MKKPRAKRVKTPRHAGEVRAFRFALRLDQDGSALHRALDLAWALRNDLAAERQANSQALRAARHEGRPPPARISKREQEMALAKRRRREPQGAGRLHSLVVKDIADRVDEGWKRFWEALAEGRSRVRPPRPIKRERCRSLTFPQYGNGVRLHNGRVELSMLGWFRLHNHRRVRGRMKTVTLKWAQGRWWCVITAESQAREVYAPAREGAPNVGADPGLRTALTFSDGRQLNPPRALKAALSELRHESRALSRKVEHLKARQAAENAAAKAKTRNAARLPWPNRLKRQIARVGRVHTKVSNIRDHWHKLGARRTAERYGRVAYEEHGLQFMLQNRRLARSASDRALGAQVQALTSALGPRLVLTPNRREGIGGNSQTCLCDAPVPKRLGDEWHDGPACGLSAPRDLVSANIVERIAFGTHHLDTAPGRGPSAASRQPEDAEGATARARESVSGPDGEATTAHPPVRAHAVPDTPGDASTFCDLMQGNTAGGHGLRRKARPVPIGPQPLAREPKPRTTHLRKHPASAR